jgi:hypothetical protein
LAAERVHYLKVGDKRVINVEKTEFKEGYFRSLGYDETQKQLHVRFEDGSYIIYYEVFKLDYVGLMSSNNMKKFFEDRIKPRFPCKKMND